MGPLRRRRYTKLGIAEGPTPAVPAVVRCSRAARLLWVAALAAVPWGSAAGQTREPSALEASLTALPAGTLLRVENGAGEPLVGSFVSLSAGALLIERPSGVLTFQEEEIGSLWVRGDRKRTGAWIGAALGMVLTGALCIETFGECGLEVGLLVVTPVLALAGAGIGSVWPRWSPLYP